MQMHQHTETERKLAQVFECCAGFYVATALLTRAAVVHVCELLAIGRCCHRQGHTRGGSCRLVVTPGGSTLARISGPEVRVQLGFAQEKGAALKRDSKLKGTRKQLMPSSCTASAKCQRCWNMGADMCWA